MSERVDTCVDGTDSHLMPTSEPAPEPTPATSATLDAIIVGAGFAGIGMAVALRKQGVTDFVVLEKGSDVGGVWRDNSYPGAACDIPSHLYSFSFEPNPDWSHVFSPQAEINEYLRWCADKYDLLRHVRFSAEVAQAQFDEAKNRWMVSLTDGSTLYASLLITATGQLSRPVSPKLPGIEDFAGPCFHSAHWNHDYPLADKRIAVIGTGASAVQFVPAIAGQVRQLSVFQRSANYLIPRPDRAYSARGKALFRRWPWLMKLYRLGIYLGYETRAVGFTRFTSLMKLGVGWPFSRQLKKQVPPGVLRDRLRPDYPIGCKRVLLSSNYLATLTRPNVELVTDAIRRVTARGIETMDGRRRDVDAIIFGTGFAATEFLAPMRILGRAGRDLNDAWRNGAAAYLGLTVPGFPNFFMLYGPNTNLGHSSIIYMLESQIRHVVRCLQAMHASGMNRIEVDRERFGRYNRHVQKRLRGTVWNGCSSWYIDANGHNSTNWPGFTMSYRWLTAHASLSAYQLTRAEPTLPSSMHMSDQSQADIRWIAEPSGIVERFFAAFLRGFLRTFFRPVIGPPYSAVTQRRAVAVMATLMPGRGGVQTRRQQISDLPVSIVAPRNAKTDGAMLYLHGGAFCLGSPRTHRSITSHLAIAANMPVWVPDYRLAPEYAYPAALNDALDCYRAMRDAGYRAEQIVIAGDSAGGALALALALALLDAGEAAPAALALISPVTDAHVGGETISSRASQDPMIRQAWVEQGIAWYAAPSGGGTSVLERDLSDLPPMMIQVGDQEILLSDATRLAEHATRCGVTCELQIHLRRWHVFHLQTFYLRSAVSALQALGAFARARVTNTPD